MTASRTPQLSRRAWLKLAAFGVAGSASAGWFEQLAEATAQNPRRRRSCLLLWMSGGPSQMDTFDLKPGHANGGPFRAIDTNVRGIQISEHLPQLARQMDRMCIIRSMTSREGDHGRGTYLMHTGYLPQGAIQYPTFGSLVSREIGDPEAALPNFVSIAPYRVFSPQAYTSGFLGPQYAPLLVGDNGGRFVFQQGQNNNYEDSLRVQDLTPPGEVTQQQADARINLLEDMQRDFVRAHPSVASLSHQTAYNRAVRLMRTAASAAFNLDEEQAALRDRYGRNLFGQGCLLARRLVERGVPFIEVNLGYLANNPLGWDTHNQNFDNVRRLCEVMDPAWATLMQDLRDRGLLDTTTIVWMGEFGRTPRINPQQGRDHYPNAWTTVIAGGGIRGGRVVGATSADGTTVEAERTTTVADFLSTVCLALGIDPTRQNMSNVGRPIPLVDRTYRPHREIIA